MLFDIIGFVLFFVFWVIIFSFLHRILGRDVDIGDKRYPNVTEAARYFLHTWIFSTGGGKTLGPEYDMWYSFNKLDAAGNAVKGVDAAGKETSVMVKELKNTNSTVMIYTVYLSQIIN